MSRVRVPDGAPYYELRLNKLFTNGPLVKWPKTPASHAGNTSSNLVRVTKLNRTAYAVLDILVGVYCDEGPPVPIPNTEVKLICAEDTWRAAARENRKAPTQRKHTEKSVCFFFVS